VLEDSGGPGPVCEINVTPMTDVLLCLLIIFMVSSPPPPSHKQPMNLPTDKQAVVPDDPNATLLIELYDDGSATLGESKLASDFDGMVEQIEKSEKANADGRIAIKAGDKVPYGKVINVMSAARKAGIPSVGIASERL
jgi:biopolymer transport protein ExbD